MQVSINYTNVSVAEIKKDFYLEIFCPQKSEQLENIALTIKLLYFYCDMLKGQYPSDLESLLCRDIIITSYSVIDGLVGCLGYKIQSQCYNCKNRCNCFSQSLFKDDEVKNERNLFINADKYLRLHKIIDLTPSAREYYDNYREARNNVHLTKNAPVITADSRFTRERCRQSIQFLNNFVEMLHVNYTSFVKKNKCFR